MLRQKKEKKQTEKTVTPVKRVRRKKDPVGEIVVQQIAPTSHNFFPHLLILGMVIFFVTLLLSSQKDSLLTLLSPTKKLPTTSMNISAVAVYDRIGDSKHTLWQGNMQNDRFKDFPQRVAVVTSDTGIDVVDLKDERLYFHCALPGIVLGDRSKISLMSHEGKVFVGVSGVGVYGIDFSQDFIFHLSASGYAYASSVEEVCADPTKLVHQKLAISLVDDAVTSLAQVVRDGHQFVAIGSQKGITLLDSDDLSAWYIHDASLGATQLIFDARGTLYIASNAHKTIAVIKTIFSQLKGTIQDLSSIVSYTYGLQALSGNDSPSTITTIQLDPIGSLLASNENALWIGTTDRLFFIQEKKDHALQDNVVVFAQPYSSLGGFRQFNILEGSFIQQVLPGQEIIVITHDATSVAQRLAITGKTIHDKKTITPETFFVRVDATKFLVSSTGSGVAVKTFEQW